MLGCPNGLASAVSGGKAGLPRTVGWLSGLALVTGLVYLMATASTLPADPTEAGADQSHATVVANSAVIVFARASRPC